MECHTEQNEEGELIFVNVLPLNHLHIGGSSAIGQCARAVEAMLRLEELDFIKALSTLELSPVFLRELRKAMAVGNKKTLAATKANISSLSAFKHQRSTSSETMPPVSIRSSLRAKEKTTSSSARMV